MCLLTLCSNNRLDDFLRCIGLILLALFFSFNAYGEPKPTEDWFPPSISAVVVSNNMVSNGIEMQVWELRSNESAKEIENYYKNLWGSETTLMNYDAGVWRVVGYAEKNWFVSMQLLKNQIDGFGYLTISKYPVSPVVIDPSVKNSLPVDSEVLSDITSKDGPHRGTTLTFKNKHSVASNVNFFRNFYGAKGWVEDVSPNVIADSRTLLFRKGANSATVSLNKSGRATAGIVVLMEH